MTDTKRLALAAKQRVEAQALRDPNAAIEQHPAAVMMVELTGDFREHRAETKATLANQDVTLTRIEKQAKLTNGRVNSLEEWRNYIVAFVAGATAVLAAAGYLATDRLIDALKGQVRQIIREEINAPSHLEKLKGAMHRRADDPPQLTRHP
jgi:short subunit dehydrogenase-like uncharacterized protein